MSTASTAYEVLKTAISILQEVIRTGENASMVTHNAQCKAVTLAWMKEKELDQTRKLDQLLTDMPVSKQRTLRHIVKGKASGWLMVLPLQADGYDMSATQFRDQLAIQYHQELSELPAVCDGYSAPFSLQHGLNCMKGGLVKKGHNNL